MAVLSFAEVQQYAANAGFKGADLATMTLVAMAESSGNTLAHNPAGTGDGLVQINLRAHPDVSLAQAQDPQFAMNYAYKLWKANGFQPWEAYTTGAYKDPKRNGGISGTSSSGGFAGALSSAANFASGGLYGDVTGAVSSTASGLAGVGSALSSTFNVISKAASWISTAHNWVRILEVVGGIGAAYLGVELLARSGSTIGQGAKRAVSVPVKAAGKAAELAAME